MSRGSNEKIVPIKLGRQMVGRRGQGGVMGAERCIQWSEHWAEKRDIEQAKAKNVTYLIFMDSNNIHQ